LLRKTPPCTCTHTHSLHIFTHSCNHVCMCARARMHVCMHARIHLNKVCQFSQLYIKLWYHYYNISNGTLNTCVCCFSISANKCTVSNMGYCLYLSLSYRAIGYWTLKPIKITHQGLLTGPSDLLIRIFLIRCISYIASTESSCKNEC